MSRVSESPLVRPSQLARFWELHPRTVYTWIREGRLAATRSPGNQFRVRVADVRALCERESLPFPPFLLPKARTVIVVGAREAERRAIRRAIKSGAQVETLDDSYEGLFAIVRSPPDVVAIAATLPGVDIEAALRALRGIDALASAPIVVFDVPTAARSAALERAGATTVLTRAKRAELARTIAQIVDSA